MMNKKLLLSASVVSLFAVAGLAVADQPKPSSDGGAVAALADPVATVVKTVPAAEAAAFRVFRTTAPTPMPAAAAAAVGSPNKFGRNSALARSVRTATGTGWVIPGNGFICLAVPDPVDGFATSCLPTAVAAQRGLDVGLTGATGRTIETVLVPDGGRAVELASPASTHAPLATASAVRRTARAASDGIVTLRTNAPGSLRVIR